VKKGRYMNNHKSAFLLAISMGLYILAGIALISAEWMFPTMEEAGTILAALLCILPTCLLIYRNKVYPGSRKEKREELREPETESIWNQKYRRVFRLLAAAIWIGCAILYMVVGTITDSWAVTWVLFVLAFALHNVVYHLMYKMAGR